MSNDCFHCGEPLRGSTLLARIEGENRPVCCAGCRAVAEWIAGAGLEDYYRYRTAPAPRPLAADPAASESWAAYAREDLAAAYIETCGEQHAVTLAVEGLRCSACGWLIERTLRQAPGVLDCSANAATARVHVTWRPTQQTLAGLLQALAPLGYRAVPLRDAAGTIRQHQTERAEQLKRLVVAGFGMMQVMMFAVAIYATEFTGEVMDPGLLRFFRIVSLLVATPVMFYAGAPILLGGWRNLRERTIGMDVPVSIALLLAYGASVWNTLALRPGAVYFDSVTMFIFFVTLGRFVQSMLQYRATAVSDALARQLPAAAHRYEGETLIDVPTSALRVDDQVLVRAGELLPADGIVVEGATEVDESLLTGESLPVARRRGDHVSAGTVNGGQSVRIRVTAAAADTLLSHLVALMQRAQSQKPALARAADAAAVRFLGAVLVGAALTAGAWLLIDPARAFPATLAVLVVACPCAFAIAMPAALSAATAALARRGVLVTRPDALESLARVDRILFDKTGTLTRGEIRIRRSVALADLNARRCLQIAAALEAASEHPLARAFATYGQSDLVDEVRTRPGRGVEGVLAGRRYRIGTPAFVAELRGATVDEIRRPGLAGTLVVLGDEQRELAVFELEDALRTTAPGAIRALRHLGLDVGLMSGDAPLAVTTVADLCGITAPRARCAPADKLAEVVKLQHAGQRVAMVGDGVNDAPVLAAADVSVAMGRGAALAQTQADFVLVGESLDALPESVAIARRTLAIARQNLIWAAAYNFAGLPLAALGWIPPWAAALGMSLSSVAVMLNALRLLPRSAQRGRRARRRPTAPQDTGTAPALVASS